ncbi:MAG: glycosyl transferase family 1, partial [Bacteroidota bacterium]
MVQLEDYIPVVGQSTVDELSLLARRLEGKQIQNINSTAVGGGVAEILTRMIPLLNQMGVQARWEVIKGDEKFFVVTKKFHNGLHGVPVAVSNDEYDWFMEVNRQNAREFQFADIVFVHDPQPVALVERRNETGGKWVWRCHIDFSKPDKNIWKFLEQHIIRYDAAVFSAPAFARRLPIPQVLIS